MPELRTLAKSLGIDTKGIRKKDDLIKLIQESDTEVLEAEVIEEDETTDLAVSFEAGKITANFESLEDKIDKLLETYEGWTPLADNEEDVEQCKNHRVYLNGLANQIDERRKAYKKQFLAPLNEFETKANRLRDKVKTVADRMKAIENEADEDRKNRKKEALEDHYIAYAGILADVVPYEKIADPKWLNKQPVLEKAKLELEDKVESVANDWNALKELNIENYQDAELEFFRTLNLGEAIAYAKQQLDDRRKLDDAKAEIDRYKQPAQEEPSAPSGNYTYGAIHEDPMEQEYIPYDPQPIQAVENDALSVQQELTTALSAFPHSKLKNLLQALKQSQRSANQPAYPYIMIIDSAQQNQLDVLGKFCGLLGITGRFKRGTLPQVIEREHQAAKQVMPYVG